MNSLEKRDYEDVLSKSDREVADIISKKIMDRSRLTIDKIQTPSGQQNSYMAGQQRRNREESEFALDLTNEQIQRLMNFDTEINDLILRVSLSQIAQITDYLGNQQ
jgi:hypothetical protein